MEWGIGDDLWNVLYKTSISGDRDRCLAFILYQKNLAYIYTVCQNPYSIYHKTSGKVRESVLWRKDS